MKKSDLIKVKKEYTFFRSMLFNNDIPELSQIDFTLNSLTDAVAYSKHNPKPRKSGNIHEISFSKYYLLDDNDLKSVLIHEMIHLWQDSHVKEERYKICTHKIAHDHVFIAKMNTINMLLARNMYDIKISVLWEKNIKIDPVCEAKKPFTVIFAKLENGAKIMFKCKDDHAPALIEQIKSLKNLEKLFKVSTTSYRFALTKFVKKLGKMFIPAKESMTGKDMYEEFVNDPSAVWYKN